MHRIFRQPMATLVATLYLRSFSLLVLRFIRILVVMFDIDCMCCSDSPPFGKPDAQA